MSYKTICMSNRIKQNFSFLLIHSVRHFIDSFFLFAEKDPTTNSVVLKGHCIPTTAYIGVKGKSREKKKIETFKRHRVLPKTLFILCPAPYIPKNCLSLVLAH